MAVVCEHTFKAGDNVQYNKLYLDEQSTGRKNWYGAISRVLSNGETLVVQWFNRGVPVGIGYVHHTWLQRHT